MNDTQKILELAGDIYEEEKQLIKLVAHHFLSLQLEGHKFSEREVNISQQMTKLAAARMRAHAYATATEETQKATVESLTGLLDKGKN